MNAQLRDVGAVICAAGAGLAPAERSCTPCATSRHRRVDPAAGLVDHEQEDRRGNRRAGARRQGRQRRVPRRPRGRPGTRERTMGRARRGRGGRTTVALVTDMSTPLGHRPATRSRWPRHSTCSPAGDHPMSSPSPSRWLARCSRRSGSTTTADHLAGGQAMDTWRAMIAAQGGDPDATLPTAAHTDTVVADGRRDRHRTRRPGRRARRIMAPRCCRARPGDVVQSRPACLACAARRPRPSRQALMTMHTRTPERLAAARAALDDAVTLVTLLPSSGIWCASVLPSETMTTQGRVSHRPSPGPPPSIARRRSSPRRCSCTTTSTAACGPPPFSTWPGERVRRAARGRRGRTRPVVP